MSDEQHLWNELWKESRVAFRVLDCIGSDMTAILNHLSKNPSDIDALLSVEGIGKKAVHDIKAFVQKHRMVVIDKAEIKAIALLESRGYTVKKPKP